MFSLLFKKNNKSIKNKVEKKNHRVSISGMSVYADWYIIMTIGVIMLFISILHSYSTYRHVSDIEVSESIDESVTNKLDVERLNSVILDMNL
ncbi:MAG: hypothetical protein ACI9GH_000085 [Candidatus Paceibacteria bacterium]|jgi:hypothetical protein